MTTPDQQLETAIVAAGANVAPRITPADIDANIVECHYFTADEGVYGREVLNSESVSTPEPHGPLGLLTFCVLVLRNGFTVTGESACASPENFNAEIGRRIARENAVAKVWPLMGYELRTRIAEGRTTIADRTGLSNGAGGFQAADMADQGASQFRAGHAAGLQERAIEVTDEMVARFLGWKLPDDFAPDCYVSFNKDGAKSDPSSWPTGTNLLHAGQVKDMLRHVLGVA